MTAIRRATMTDRPELARSLASAFSEDPLFRWMVGPDAPLEARMRIFFEAILGFTLRQPDHLVFVSDDGRGAAVWQPVDKWKVPPWAMLRVVPSMVRAFRARTPVMFGAINAIERVHPAESHYYLEVLGTRRDAQGTGIGSAVMTDMLARCDEEGVPAYLESSNPRNIPFYARHGFEVRDEIVVGKGAPVVTAMWRDPRVPD